MINEDFSIKTGIEVDDSGVSQLKSIADELEKTAKALQKINNVKFNGDIFSGLTNAGKNIQNVTKEIDKLQKSVTNTGKVFDRDDFLSGKSFITKNKKDATSQLRESYKERMALQKSLESTDDKNGIWFSKEYLEADYKYLQSIKEAAAKGINKSTFDKYASNSFYKYGASDIEDDLKEASLALQDYYSTIDEIKKENKIDFIPKDIERKIALVVQAKSNLRNQLDNDPYHWKDSIKFWKDDIKYDIDNLKFDGKLTPPKIDTSNISEAKQEIEDTKKDLSAISSGEYSLLDVASIDAIKSSMESIATSAQNLKETLGSEVTSGLMTQINEMLAKKDELQNLANILKSNKEDLDKAAKAAGVKRKNKNTISEDVYNANYKKWQSEGVKSLEAEYPRASIVGAKISQTESGLVKLSASIRTAEGEWKKYNATVSKTGELVMPSVQNMKDTASAEKAFQNIKAGKLDSKDFLNFDEVEAYAQKLNQLFEEAYGKTDEYTARVGSEGNAVISKTLPSGEEVTVMQARLDDVRQIMSEYEQVAGDAVKVKELVEKNVSSISAKVSPSNKKSTNNTSSSTSTKTPKYVTDQSYVGDYKTLADNEAFVRTLDTFRHNTTEAQAAIKERDKIMARVNAKTPQNTAETNAKQRFDDIDKTIADNFSKYGDRIKSAYAAFDKIKADKSGIAGIGDVFKSSEEQINKWATAVAKSKMGIDEFEKKVSGLNGSVGSIGKIIDSASITDAKGELESYLKELTGIQDITFSGFTEKNGIVSLKGTFKDSAGEAQTLSVQLNTLNGQIKNLGTSVKPAESGLSKFFSGWKEKMVNLAQYLTSFQAMNQIWNTFKQGLEVVKEFDTALTEMRKVSDEPISKLKEFQKESFDMAKSVGTTALQIQNSTADFQRLGWT